LAPAAADHPSLPHTRERGVVWGSADTPAWRHGTLAAPWVHHWRPCTARSHACAALHGLGHALGLLGAAALVRLRLDALADLVHEGSGGRLAAHIRGGHARLDGAEDGALHAVRKVGQAQVPQHHDGGQQDARGVGGVLASQVQPHVARALLEHGATGAHGHAGGDAGAAHQARDAVGDEGAVEIGRHHDVELLRLADELHHAVVHDHLLVLDVRPRLSDLREAGE